MSKWLEEAPRWFLMWALVVAVGFGSFASGLAFNLLMLREREFKDGQIAPALQGIADLGVRMNRLENDVSVLKAQSQKVDTIDENVRLLLKRKER